MRARFLGALAVAGALVLPLRPAPAAAHPLGNFTVNTYAGIVLAPASVRIDYVLDMAEIPTFQELERIDVDGDGAASEDEVDAWSAARAAEILARLSLAVDGRSVALERVQSSGALLPGQGGLSVLRLDATFTGDLPRSGRAVFEDANVPGRIGWREVTVAGSDGVETSGSSAPAESVSAGLNTYPEDLLSSPLRVTSATFSFAPGRGGLPTEGPADPSSVAASARRGGGLSGLVASAELTLPFVLLSLLLAAGFGALHALAPGHGKALVAAYLVGSGGRMRHAVSVGLAVAAMHSASVLVLGTAILVADRSFAPERTYPWFGTVAGAAAAALGVWLLITRLRGLGSERRRAEEPNSPGHDRHHAHEHPHGASGAHRTLSARGLVSLALAGGILPSPSALLTLLAAAAVHRLAFGLALVAAFSVGLALTLVGVGALAVRARDSVGRRLSGRWRRILPVGSAVAILGVGMAMTARGLLSL